MKIAKKCLTTIVLGTCFVFSAIPSSAYSGILRKEVEIPRKYAGMSMDEICREEKKLPSEELISEIKKVEKIDSSAENTYLLTMLAALKEKDTHFSKGELLQMIQDPETGNGLNETLVQIYADENLDRKGLIQLLDNDNIDLQKKETIVCLAQLSQEELSDVFEKHDNILSVRAMQQIAVNDNKKAIQLARPILNNVKGQSDEKLISACLGAASYYENNTGLKIRSFELEKKNTIGTMKKIFLESENDLVKDQAFYAMSRICDYDTFSYMIESDEVDFDLKVTAIERNIGKMIEQIEKASSKKDVQVILKAMKLHPICEVGEQLQKAVDSGKITSDKEIAATIDYVKNEGLKGVYKYEK